eukprot:TRINITY_DN6175_c0_g1_i1.p1 TRINITY_DN6175_c0_g1~~TRINITY_DN6175_c0_g1_i1.p1  ORF type:complete len:1884 (+),score=692.51 TRINITY_DN6175_c0_g1_i1:165-5816(+)
MFSASLQVVVAMNGEEHALEVAAFDTVGDLVEKVSAELAPPDRFTLRRNERPLGEAAATLGDLGVQDGDKLVLEVPEVVLTVSVDGQVGKWAFADTATVGAVKARVQAEACLTEEIELRWKHAALDDDGARLHELGFGASEDVEVVLPRLDVRVSIEGLGDCVMHVRKYDTLRRLKQMVRLECPLLAEHIEVSAAPPGAGPPFSNDNATMEDLGITGAQQLFVAVPFALIANAQLEERGWVVTEDAVLDCAMDGDWDGLKLLLATEQVTGADALVECAGRGLTREVRGLLQHNVRPVATPRGTPLIHAAEGDHKRAGAALLSAGADVDEAFDGVTALEAALDRKHYGFAEMLLDRGCRTGYGRGQTALAAAAAASDVAAAELLLSYGAAADEPNHQQHTPLHIVAKTGRVDLAALLVSSGAAVDAVVPTSRCTPLLVAATCGQLDVVKLLLQSGAWVNHQDKGGRTALVRAALEGHVDTVRALLGHHAVKVDLPSDGGGTALFAAAHAGHVKVAAALIAARADVHRRAEDGKTPLACARCAGHTALVSLLLAQGAGEHRSPSPQNPLLDAAGPGSVYAARRRGQELSLAHAGAEGNAPVTPPTPSTPPSDDAMPSSTSRHRGRSLVSCTPHDDSSYGSPRSSDVASPARPRGGSMQRARVPVPLDASVVSAADGALPPSSPSPRRRAESFKSAPSPRTPHDAEAPDGAGPAPSARRPRRGSIFGDSDGLGSFGDLEASQRSATGGTPLNGGTPRGRRNSAFAEAPSPKNRPPVHDRRRSSLGPAGAPPPLEPSATEFNKSLFCASPLEIHQDPAHDHAAPPRTVSGGLGEALAERKRRNSVTNLVGVPFEQSVMINSTVSDAAPTTATATPPPPGKKRRPVRLSFMAKDRGKPEFAGRQLEPAPAVQEKETEQGQEEQHDDDGAGAPKGAPSKEEKAELRDGRDVAGWVAATAIGTPGTPPVDDLPPQEARARGRAGAGVPPLDLEGAGEPARQTSFPDRTIFARRMSVGSSGGPFLNENITPRGKQLSHLARRGSQLVMKSSQRSSPSLRSTTNGQRSGRTFLTAAAFDGNVDSMRLLLKGKCDVNEHDEHGVTALIAAVYNGHTAAVDLLLKHGAGVNVADRDGMTPLMYAAVTGEAAIISKLIAKRAKVNRQDYESGDARTALMRAAQYGHRAAAEVLLLRGANADLQTATGTTALMLAALEGHDPVVALLLQHGAGPNVENAGGRTALSCAAFGGHPNVVRTLLDDDEVDVGHADSQRGDTPLNIAAGKGHGDVVDALLQHPACPVNAANARGRTALMCAAARGQRECADLLLRAGADSNVKDCFGNTALMYAAQGDCILTFDLLLACALDVNERNDHKASALFYVVANNNTAMLALLLKDARLNVNLAAVQGVTPVMTAAMHGHLDIVKALADRGARVGARTATGKTASDIAAKHGHRSCAEYLEGAEGAGVDKRPSNASSLAKLPGPFKDGGDGEATSPVSPRNKKRVRRSLRPVKNGGGEDTPPDTLSPATSPATNGLVSPVSPASRALKAGRRQSKTPSSPLKSRRGSGVPQDEGRDGQNSLVLAAQRGELQKVHAYLTKPNPYLVDETGADGRSALQAASLNCHRDVMELLLSHGANVDHRDNLGLTAMALAAQQGHNTAIEKLVNHGADPNLPGKDGRTPLMRAAWCKHLAAVKTLLQHQADPAATDNEGRGIIIYATMAGDKDVVRLIAKSNPQCGLNHMPDDGKTALMRAAYKGFDGVASILVAHGADPNIANPEGRTPLMQATTCNHIAIVKFFVTHARAQRTNLDAQDKDGFTALMRAAAAGRREITEVLLEGGASPAVKSNEGKTAKTIAEEAKQAEIAELLAAAEASGTGVAKRRSRWACCLAPPAS